MSSSASPIIVAFIPVHTHVVKTKKKLQLVTTAHMGIDSSLGINFKIYIYNKY